MREPCELCGSTGEIEDVDRDTPRLPCLACHCTGEVQPAEEAGGTVCPKCHGTRIEIGSDGIRYMCGRCGGRGWLEEEVKASDRRDETKWPEPTTPKPDIETLREWSDRGGCEATDGCWVEPDGSCEHGAISWMRYLGMI